MFGITGVLSLVTQVKQVEHPDEGGEAKATFFVAKDGNDAWSGKLPAPNAENTDGPFATLARALSAVRSLRVQGLENPVTVMVRGGKYYLDECLVFGPEDSGTRDCPITYMAYPGEKPILSGGRKISGWKPYKGKILQCELEEAKGGKWKFRQLFLDGKRQIRARYPNFDQENPLYGGWAFMEGPVEQGSSTAFKYKPGTFKHHWAKPAQGEVNVFPGSSWLNNIIPIKAVDEKTRVITLTHSTRNGNLALPGLHPEPLVPPVASWWEMSCPFRPGNRFYVENLLEELDQPGEWCLDMEDGIVYFWPPTESIEGAEVVAPALDCLIDLRGASWIKISGFTFTETTGGDNFHHGGGHGYGPMFPTQGLKYCGDSVHLKGAEHCVIENNNFYAVGGNGVYLEGYNARNLIRHNEISHAGACGVSLLGSKEEHPLYNEVEDNHIHHTGVYNKFSAGVFLGLSEGNFISHNLIEHVPNHAINLGSNGFGRNFVEYNEIRYACQETHDNGAINSWMEGDRNELTRDAERSGHIIRYNFIADTPGEAYLKHLGKGAKNV